MDKQFTIHNTHIGNVLNFDTGEGLLPTILDWQDIKWLSEDPEDFSEDHYPIVLTLEELGNLGFSGKDYDKGYIGIDVGDTDFVLTSHLKLELEAEGFYFEFKYGGWPRIKKFNYVHTLQNFFSALYEKELIYKMPK
jgi:hypothetical protein